MCARSRWPYEKSPRPSKQPSLDRLVISCLVHVDSPGSRLPAPHEEDDQDHRGGGQVDDRLRGHVDKAARGHGDVGRRGHGDADVDGRVVEHARDHRKVEVGRRAVVEARGQKDGRDGPRGRAREPAREARVVAHEDLAHDGVRGKHERAQKVRPEAHALVVPRRAQQARDGAHALGHVVGEGHAVEELAEPAAPRLGVLLVADRVLVAVLARLLGRRCRVGEQLPLQPQGRGRDGRGRQHGHAPEHRPGTRRAHRTHPAQREREGRSR